MILEMASFLWYLSLQQESPHRHRLLDCQCPQVVEHLFLVQSSAGALPLSVHLTDMTLTSLQNMPSS